MTKHLALGIAAMAIIVVLSNILVQYLLGKWLTWGALTYPLAFLVTDIMNRLYGAATARKVVFFGFMIGVACSLIGSQIEGEFGPIVTIRVAVASGIAFLAAQLLDVAIFDQMRSGAWWRAPVVSSLIGAAVDTALFFSIAFSAQLAGFFPSVDVGWANAPEALLGVGPTTPFWVSLAVADFMVKVALAIIALVPFRLVVRSVRGQVG